MAFRIVRVQRRIAAPIERVFATVADHEGYAGLPGVRRARLVRSGYEQPDGIGAQRELTIGPGRMTEQVTAYDPPYYLAYRIIRGPFPIQHAGSEIRLREVAGGTHVEWVTRFRSKTPVGRRVVEQSVAVTFTAALGTALFFWKQILESADPDWRQALPRNSPDAEPLAIRPKRAPRSRLDALRPRTLLPATRTRLRRTLRSVTRWPGRVMAHRASRKR